MDTKLRQISRLLKRYDSYLFPKRYLDGSLGIYRKKTEWETYQLEGETLRVARPFDDLVLPVTDNWTESGRPVDWGIEPLYWQISKLDGWRDGEGEYERFAKSREAYEANRQRAWRNDVRARAYDCRREFARAVNDVNTSSLEKIDRRRTKWQS